VVLNFWSWGAIPRSVRALECSLAKRVRRKLPRNRANWPCLQWESHWLDFLVGSVGEPLNSTGPISKILRCA